MSLAWKGPVVLVREPSSAGALRLARRAGLGSLWLVAAWFVSIPALRVLFIIFGVGALAFAALAAINLARNKRVVLELTASGVLERPRSLQETWLRTPPQTVAGREVSVGESEFAIVKAAGDPRVTFTAGEQSLARVPLYGEDVAAFVERANGLLAGRDVTLRYVPRAVDTPAEEADEQ